MMPYRILCILPNMRYVTVSKNGLTTATNVHHTGNIPENIHQIRVLDEKKGSLEITENNITFQNRYSFEYVQSLVFLHEKIIRNLISFSYSSSNQDDNSSDEIHSMVKSEYCNIKLYLKHIGIVEGVDVGYGLFTELPMDALEYIGEYVGLICPHGTYSNKSCALNYPCDDISEDSLEINALEYGNLLRFVNHSPNPNAILKRVYIDGLLHMVCFAQADIPAMTQITIDYGPEYWLNRKHEMISLEH